LTAATGFKTVFVNARPRIFFGVIAAAGLVIFTACASTPRPPPDTVVGPEDFAIGANDMAVQMHDQVELTVGGNLTVVLPGNPTTGYSWELLSADETLLPSQGQRLYKSDPIPINPTTTNAIKSGQPFGSGGRFIFHFRARIPGVATLKFAYQRSGDEDLPPPKTYDVLVTIH
jgi:inhibitor of cysteine peptidase